MVKTFNINIVIILTALITTIGTAPVWDDSAIIAATRKMRKSAGDVINHRKLTLDKLFLGRSPADLKSYIRAQIAEAVSRSIPQFYPFNEDQLFKDPNDYTVRRLQFISAYHALVFERLKTLFLKIQNRMAEQQISEVLTNGLYSVAVHLIRSKDLEGRCRERLRRLCSRKGPKWRELKLPNYDWERKVCRSVPDFNQVNDFVGNRTKKILRGLPFSLRAVSDPTPCVAARIAQIRSVPRPFPFTEAQLLENPNASMPEVQLHLTRAYHCLVFEELKTLFLRIKYHISANENEERLEQALAEVGRAVQMHYNLESKYGGILKRTHNKCIVQHKKLKLPEYDWARLDSILSMQSPPEGQNSAYKYEPISDHGLGCGLEASTSQPRPQPVLIDFLGVADMTWEATPELAPPFGHSRDDRDPLPDNRSSNELHRSPSDCVGGGSMHPGPSTDDMRRPGDLSLHGHQTTSDSRAAGSPQKNSPLKLFGIYLNST
ncbi:hypothetical protein SeLEV6574_g08195 [Synchytrium endobioticum]|uniref:Uncharacterized protein n=1 Tax=Synchytrium endobioticum TaxID=286115 RepID=A0A507C7S6_9FUNG|nr:hypothetical protein SeLEV6574_g08195 [Synchytrium endobioticum]